MESNKTDGLSFDNVFKRMKDDTKPMLDLMGCPELLGDILNEIETNRRRFKIFYDAGQQSKQVEIDHLQKRVKELELINFDSELHFDAAKEHIDHLQKRIDEALNTSKEFYDFGDGESAMAFCNEIINTLKGEESK